LSFFFFVEKESTEAAFAIKGMKFMFRSEVACQGALRILEGKNETLKKANPTGQFPQALTMRFPDGTPIRTEAGKLRKEFITVPFLLFGAYPPCFLHTCLCLSVYNNSVCTMVHTMMLNTYSPVTAQPPLGYNNTSELCPNSSVQSPLNVTKPLLIQSSSRFWEYQERIMPLYHAIACIVDHGNLHLQQRARKSVLRIDIYVYQIICNRSNRAQMLRSISSRWRFKSPRGSTVTNAP